MPDPGMFDDLIPSNAPPAGYVVDPRQPFDPDAYLKNKANLPKSPGVSRTGNYFDRFDPDEYLRNKAPHTGGMFDDLIPKAASSSSGIPFVGSAREWAASKINPTEPHGTSIYGTPISKTPDTYSGTVGQYAKEALRDVGRGWSNLMEATDPQRTTPSPVGTPSALAQMAGGLGRAAISPATALVNPAWEYLTGIPGGEAAGAVTGAVAPESGVEALGALSSRVPSTIAARTAPERGSALSIPGTLQRQGPVDLAALERDLVDAGSASAASSSDLPVPTPRGDLGIRLLDPDVPHDLAPRGRASVGAAATEASPLAEYSPQTVQRARELLTDSGLDNPYRLEQVLDEVSPHHTFAELSPALEKEVSGIAAADRGVAKNLIAQTYLERAKEAPQRMAAAFDRAFGPPQNLTDLQRAIEAERAKAATPLWRQFTQTTVPPTPALRALLPRLDAAGALKAANKAMREEGLPVQQGFARAVTDEAGEWAEQVEHMPTAAAFQYAKEHLDGLIERSLATPGEAKAARRYTKLKNDLIAAIDRHPDPQVAGVWQAARRAWQQPTELLEAQNLGRRLLTGNVDREDLPGLVAGWGPERMQHLAIGVRNYLEDLEKSNRSAARTSNRLLDAVLAPGNQDKLRAVLGDAQAEQLIEAIRHEESMHGAPTRIIGGSPTAERQAARDRYTAEGQGAVGKGLSKIAGYMRHPVRSLAADTVEAGAKHISTRQEAQMAQLRDELSRIMTTQGPERNAIARALIGAEEPPPSTWARPGGIVPPQAPAAAATASARPQAVWSEGGWRAVSPDEVARMQEAAQARQAAQRPQKAPSGPKSPSLLQFLAARGGLKPTGDLRYTLDNNPVVPGYGRLFRAGGMSEEDAMTAAVEAGYLDTEQGIRGRGNIRDFHDAVHEEAHGRKRYPIGEGRTSPADVEAFRHSEAQDILHALEQQGAHIPDDRIGDRIVDLVRNHGMHPEMAHERAILEDSHVGQNDGLPALPAQAATRLSDVANATSQARVQAQPAQGQPTGAGTGSSALLPRQEYPEAAQRGLGLHSEAVKRVAALREANRLGLTPRIQQMALHGASDRDIALAIGGRLSSSDVQLVRHHLGIGSTTDLMGGDEIPFATGGRVGFASGGGAGTGGANDETFRADLEAAGLKVSPRAWGGRALPRYQYGRVPGELSEANKASHDAVAYTDISPRKKQNCGVCAKSFLRPDVSLGCKGVKDPIVAGGWCRRFMLDGEVAEARAERAKVRA
jgi:hypothetical protein